MKEIKLSQTGTLKNRFVALVDDEDFDYLNQFNWCVLFRNSGYYAYRTLRTNEKRGTIYMHRIIMNTTKVMEVDHIDHDGLNNQKSNLRNCLHAQNQKNMSAHKNGISKYLGVCYHDNAFQVQMAINGKNTYLGRFKTEVGAAMAYDNAAKKIRGEFANLNFK